MALVKTADGEALAWMTGWAEIMRLTPRGGVVTFILMTFETNQAAACGGAGEAVAMALAAVVHPFVPLHPTA